jgi:diaminopimelate epimerase
MHRIPFGKGHGTENDFVLLFDPDDTLDLTDAAVTTLCDRRRGLGADGVIRVTRAPGIAAEDDSAWFMDYRNADGSVAQMCGNGVRVMTAFLETIGAVQLAAADELSVHTRAGVKTVRRHALGYAVDLGPWFIPGGSVALDRGWDTEVSLALHKNADGHDAPAMRPGLTVDVGNPHVVVAVSDQKSLAAADLRTAPALEPDPVGGANIEIIHPRHDSSADGGHITMRVHERGVGETRSCGTGAVAAALAARVWAGRGAPLLWDVTVPGGDLRVAIPDGDILRGDHVELAGPAVIVANGHLGDDFAAHLS